MRKEVQDFLYKFGTVVPQHYHKSEGDRSGTCFELRNHGISLPKTLFQTVTVRNHLLLEVLHDAPGIDDALKTEILPLKASAQALQLRLKAIGEKASRQYIKALGLGSGCFWEDNIRESIEMLPPEVQSILTAEVELFHRNLNELRFLIKKKAKTDIAELIEIHNMLDSFDDRITQLRLSR
jgi:hypothetical protein